MRPAAVTCRPDPSRRRLFRAAIAALLLGATAHLPAQPRLDGKWQTKAGPDDVVIEFKSVKDGKISGAITRSAVPGQKPVAFEGTLKADTVTFTVTSPDGNRTVTMTGKIRGDEITFDRQAKGVGGGPGFYGLTGPTVLIAKRLKS